MGCLPSFCYLELNHLATFSFTHLTSRPGCFIPRKEPRYLLTRTLVGAWTPSGCFGEEPLSPTRIRTPDRPARSLVVVPTTLSRPVILINAFGITNAYETFLNALQFYQLNLRSGQQAAVPMRTSAVTGCSDGGMIRMTRYPRTWFLLENIRSLSKTRGTYKQNNSQCVVTVSLSSLRPRVSMNCSTHNARRHHVCRKTGCIATLITDVLALLHFVDEL